MAGRLGLFLALALTSCGNPNGRPDGEGSREEARIPSPTVEGSSQGAHDASSIPSDRAGTIELDGETASFLVVTCDLSGTREDGMLLRGTGTAPDGRRLSVEVERLAAGETVNERATVYFGGLVDGDHWTVRATQWPDGRWFADEVGSEVTEGPLIHVSPNEVTAEGAFQHQRDEATKRGRVQATCPG